MLLTSHTIEEKISKNMMDRQAHTEDKPSNDYIPHRLCEWWICTIYETMVIIMIS